MSIVPDTKDWTWVLERPCEDCGFDASTTGHEQVAGLVRDNADGWGRFLDSGADLVTRPAGRWSPLEYACHVRDVHRLYLYRLNLMLTEHDPLFANWDQDAAAVESDYRSQRAVVVRAELVDAADAIAAAFGAVPDEAWGRPGGRSDGARFSIDTFSRYFVHDPIHHLWDVTGDRFGS